MPRVCILKFRLSLWDRYVSFQVLEQHVLARHFSGLTFNAFNRHRIFVKSSSYPELHLETTPGGSGTLHIYVRGSHSNRDMDVCTAEHDTKEGAARLLSDMLQALLHATTVTHPHQNAQLESDGEIYSVTADVW